MLTCVPSFLQGPNNTFVLQPGSPAVGIVTNLPGYDYITFQLQVPNNQSTAPASLTSVSMTVTGLDIPLRAAFGSSVKGIPDPRYAATYCDMVRTFKRSCCAVLCELCCVGS